MSGSVAEGLLLTLLPLVLVTITDDPREVSSVYVVGQSPWLLLSLFAGVLIDRVRRRTVLVSACLVQVAAAAVLAVAATTGALSLALIVAVAFVVTTAQVLSHGVMGAMLPEVVDDLEAANARLMVIDQGVVRFLVPPSAGLLVGWGFGLPAGLAVAAAAAATVLALGLPSRAVVRSASHPVRDIAEGLRYLLGNRLLISITIAVALGSFAASAEVSLFVLYAKDVLGLGAVGYGVLLGCMALGWAVCSPVVSRAIARMGYARSMRVAQVGMVVGHLGFVVLPPWAWAIGVLMFAQSGIVLLWNVCSMSSRQRFTPTALLGRVLTSHRALAWGFAPLGALAGGFIADHWSLRAVWAMAAAVQVVALLVCLWQVSVGAFARAERVAVQGRRPGSLSWGAV
ncbi:MFS transporter [Saccharothrix violaceirubra]